MQRNNPFQFENPSSSVVPHATAAPSGFKARPPTRLDKPEAVAIPAGTQNPFDWFTPVGFPPPETEAQGNTPNTHFDVVDTQTLDGLAVHLNSPRLRRQYWVQHYQQDFNTLTRLAGAKEGLQHFLLAHGCPGLSRALQQDVQRHTQLQHLYKTLYHAEDTLLTATELKARAVWLALHQQFNTIKQYLKEAVFPSLGYAAPERTDGTPNRAILKNSDVAIFREWLNYLSSRQSRQSLPPQLLQELYQIKHQLF